MELSSKAIELCDSIEKKINYLKTIHDENEEILMNQLDSIINIINSVKKNLSEDNVNNVYEELKQIDNDIDELNN